MIFGSVCSGIEAASVAWHHDPRGGALGWRPAFFSEIEKFPCYLLAHRYGANMPGEPYPQIGTPNYGDMSKFQEWPDAAIDVLVGGTPCQSFSVAGLRKGLADPRGNLALTYLGIIDRYRPEWFVWENVPGVLSSSGGRDFGAFLGGVVELGYGFAYRVLDAQFVRVDGAPRAVPQRRRRVFVVGNSRSWRRAAAVLFERESLRWHSAPRRETGQGIAADVAASLVSSGRGVERTGETRGQDPVIAVPSTGVIANPVAPTLNAAFGEKLGLENQHIDSGAGMFVAHALRGEGFDASEDGSGRGTPLVPVQPIPIDMRQASRGAKMTNNRSEGSSGGAPGTGVGAPGDPAPTLATEHVPAIAAPIAFSAKDHGGDAEVNLSPTLRAGGFTGSHANAGVMPAIAIQERAVSENPDAGPDGAGVRVDGAAYTLEARTVPQAVAFDLQQITSPTNRSRVDPSLPSPTLAKGNAVHVADAWAVRRLTPRECERLQHFPDDYTLIPLGNGKFAADGPRYKALGNSMAVNVMRWIGQRIELVGTLCEELGSTEALDHV